MKIPGKRGVGKLRKLYQNNFAMRILELCAGYPDNNGSSALSYVKVRNHYYCEEGIKDITVLNFSLQKGLYNMDGFNVISLSEYENTYSEERFDILICHAPNIRNHYRFLKKYQNRFPKVVFFFHGHEVLNIKKEYPNPYSYQKRLGLSRFFCPIYDTLKFRLWHDYFSKQESDVHLVFVSEWIRSKFEEYVKLRLSDIKAPSHLIYNGVSRTFEFERYDVEATKKYDFITIRSNLDEPKYAVDVVNNLACNNPQYKFLLIGKGEFFSYFKKADNIEQVEKYLSPEEIIRLLNQSRCGLMPTKNDTQGIMACEMATFGMPLITSDIDVCKVVFDGFKNVAFISNNDYNLDLSTVVTKIGPCSSKNDKFFYNNTIVKEVIFLKSLLSNNG